MSHKNGGHECRARMSGTNGGHEWRAQTARTNVAHEWRAARSRAVKGRRKAGRAPTRQRTGQRLEFLHHCWVVESHLGALERDAAPEQVRRVLGTWDEATPHPDQTSPTR